jgi:ABC-2 type transport system permease protein
VQTAQSQLEAEAQQVAEDRAACLDDPPAESAGRTPAGRCEEPEPRLDWFLPRETLDLADQLASSGLALALVLAGAAIVIGTTFAGADWHSGSMITQLIFRPERLRVWCTKALALVLGVALASLLVTVLYWTSLGLVARARDLDLGADLAREIALHGARGVLLAVACALGAYALTMALRSTMATLALLFAYAVAGEALWASLPVTRASQWSLSANVRAWLLDGAQVTDDSICGPRGEACDPTYVLGAEHAAAYLGVLLAIALLLSLITFARRDVR